MKTVKITLMAFIAFSFALHAGETPYLKMAQADIKKVNQTYANQMEYSMETTYMVFEKHGVSNMIESKNGFFAKKDNNTYTKIDKIEVVQLSDKIISLSHENKLLSVGDNKDLDMDPIQVNADSLLTVCSEINMEMLSANEKRYKLKFDDYDISEFSEIDISIDVKNWRVMKLVLYYKQSMNLKNDFYAEETMPRVEIVYKNFRAYVKSPEIFDEQKYINITSGSAVPANGYSKYKVVDVRAKTRIKKKN